jgi:hypothetical protein
MNRLRLTDDQVATLQAALKIAAEYWDEIAKNNSPIRQLAVEQAEAHRALLDHVEEKTEDEP